MDIYGSDIDLKKNSSIISTSLNQFDFHLKSTCLGFESIMNFGENETNSFSLTNDEFKRIKLPINTGNIIIGGMI